MLLLFVFYDLSIFCVKAEVHMVENKEESLARARERGMELNLTNVWYYQANLEYYQVDTYLLMIGK